MVEEKLDRYADVILRVGLNLQPGQKLMILAYYDTAPLVRAVAKQAYQSGCPYVTVFWNDEQLGLIRLQNAPKDSFAEYPSWIMAGIAEQLRAGEAYLQIAARTPDLYSDEDPHALSQIGKSLWAAYKPVLDLQEESLTNWSLVSYITPGWARKVFPDETETRAVEKLWDVIYELSRMNNTDPVAAWGQHMDELSERCTFLNEKQYSKLTYSAPGTDLMIGLPNDHLWVGGSVQTQSGITYNPNIPTEEIYTLPHRDRIEGVVSSSRPLSYQGSMIEDIRLEFSNGKVIQASASNGEEILEGILTTDEGSRRLGEIALVPHSSPISATGLVFYHTLFDENAANHLALGSAYRSCLTNGDRMSSREFAESGGNESEAHVDFMIGSGEMDIDGVLPSGEIEPVMRSGEWSFEV